MNAERPATRLWREALAHMDLLLQQPHEQRSHALSGLAQSQPQVHSIVQSLLEAERRADDASFLEPSPRDATRALKPDALIECSRKARAFCQSRLTVDGDVARKSAISSISMPPK